MKNKILFLFFFFFLLGCSSDIQKPEIITISPPAFSFLDIDPNNTDAEYISRMEKYNHIITICPIPIYIIEQKEILVEFWTEVQLKPSSNGLLGMYVYGGKVEPWPSEFIFININLSPEEIMATFFHEYGHYTHRKNKCEGCNGFNLITKEKHALLNELKMGWEYKDSYILESSFRNIANYIISDYSIIYKLASLECTKEDIWKKTIKHLIESKKEKRE